MKTYQSTTTINNESFITYKEVTEEMIVKEQIQHLISEIPYEDLLKVFTVEKELIRQPYWQGDVLKIAVKIKI